MINLTFAGMNQMDHGLPYIMFILMVVTAVAQIRYLTYNCMYSNIATIFGR